MKLGVEQENDEGDDDEDDDDDEQATGMDQADADDDDQEDADDDDEAPVTKADAIRARMLKVHSNIEKKNLIQKKVPLEKRLAIMHEQQQAQNAGVVWLGRDKSARNKELTFIPQAEKVRSSQVTEHYIAITTTNQSPTAHTQKGPNATPATRRCK